MRNAACDGHGADGLKLAPASLVMASRGDPPHDEQGIDVEALSINPYWYGGRQQTMSFAS